MPGEPGGQKMRFRLRRRPGAVRGEKERTGRQQEFIGSRLHVAAAGAVEHDDEGGGEGLLSVGSGEFRYEIACAETRGFKNQNIPPPDQYFT